MMKMKSALDDKVYSTEPQHGEGSPLAGGVTNALGGVLPLAKLQTIKSAGMLILCVVFVVCCGNPLVKELTDPLFKKKPVSISTPAGLAAIANNLNGYYKLTADINLSSYVPWIPIGDNWTTPFTGTLDGNGHTISWLTIPSATTQYQGLFGNISGTGIVKNLGLTDVVINSTDLTIGGIAANNYGTIQNCYVTGTITGAGCVGGIVGENGGGTIENCYSTADVTETYYGWAGGITANNYSNGKVNNCYATGIINGTASGPSGGVVGFYQSGTVSNNVALNPSITGSIDSGRVAGETSVHTYINNKARINMTINGSGVSGTATNKHGAGTNVSMAVYSGLFDSTWSPSVWNIPPGSMYGPGSPLPTLKGFSGTQNPTLP